MDRRHCHGEPVCYWFREAVKIRGLPTDLEMAPAGSLSISLAGKIAARVSEVLPEVISRWGDVKSKLKRSATQGSKGAAFAHA